MMIHISKTENYREFWFCCCAKKEKEKTLFPLSVKNFASVCMYSINMYKFIDGYGILPHTFTSVLNNIFLCGMYFLTRDVYSRMSNFEVLDCMRLLQYYNISAC